MANNVSISIAGTRNGNTLTSIVVSCVEIPLLSLETLLDARSIVATLGVVKGSSIVLDEFCKRDKEEREKEERRGFFSNERLFRYTNP
jgi:hypothetical protein